MKKASIGITLNAKKTPKKTKKHNYKILDKMKQIQLELCGLPLQAKVGICDVA